jgi:hypothetical protein
MTQLVWFGCFMALFVLAIVACDGWEKEESEVDWNG